MKPKNCSTLKKKAECLKTPTCGWVPKEGCKPMKLSGKKIYIAVGDKELKAALKTQIEKHGGKAMSRFSSSANYFVTESSSYNKEKTQTIEKGSLVKAFVKKYSLNVPEELLSRKTSTDTEKNKQKKSKAKSVKQVSDQVQTLKKPNKTNRASIDSMFFKKPGSSRIFYKSTTVELITRQVAAVATNMFERQGYKVRNVVRKVSFFDRSTDAFVVPMRIRAKSSFEKLQPGANKGKNEVIVAEMLFNDSGKVSMLGYRTLMELKSTDKVDNAKLLELIQNIYGKDLYMPLGKPKVAYWFSRR